MLSAIIAMDDDCLDPERDRVVTMHGLPTVEESRQVIRVVDCTRLGFRPEHLGDLNAPWLPA